MEATVRLFRALLIREKKEKVNEGLMKKTIPFGFVFAPEVIANYSNYDELIEMVRKAIGITAEQINNSFHKSWQKVKEADLEQLVVEQIAHYLTTYGKECPEEYLEEKGLQWKVEGLAGKVSALEDIEMNKVQENEYVYIPKEVLEIPELNIEDLKLIVIRGYTKEELKQKLLNLLNLGIALSEDTKKDVLDVMTFIGIHEEELQGIKNKEVRCAIYAYLDLFPENPVEFLRFVIYRTTNKTLIIKSKELIEEIKGKDNLDVLKLFSSYDKKYGLEKLSSIFYRHKPIFLAFRTNKGLKTIINRIRKLAIKYHRPLPEDYLNNITAKIKNGEEIDIDRLNKKLLSVNVFRKIRLLYALKFRTKNVDSILYRIRNGKAYASGFEFNKQHNVEEVLEIVLESIVQDISRNVEGKRIYIPDYINYILPATEKQFIGNFPSGTCVVVPKDMIFGIHWENVGGKRIDLDLSLISPDVGKVGWDGSWRTRNAKILFSGDMTTAPEPNGASETFYIGGQGSESYIMFVNYFNFEEGVEVPFKIVVGKEGIKDIYEMNFHRNYTVNPNNVLAVVDSKINQRQRILGLVVITPQENKFYFVETNIGKSITSGSSDFQEHSRKYLFSFYENSIGLKEVLEKAGAVIVREKGEGAIDLSPESLEKDSILNLMLR